MTPTPDPLMTPAGRNASDPAGGPGRRHDTVTMDGPVAPGAVPRPATLQQPQERELCSELDPELDRELDRAALRIEFEAIIAAAYPPAAEHPRPMPPTPRVGTIVAAVRAPRRGTAAAGRGFRARTGHDPAPGGIPARERGPPP